jgi:hypothetical protein
MPSHFEISFIAPRAVHVRENFRCGGSAADRYVAASRLMTRIMRSTFASFIVILLSFESSSLSQTTRDTIRVELTSPVPLKQIQRKIVVSLGEPDSNEYAQPSPAIGWDSLAKSIGYPELAKRAELEGCYSIEFVIDANGIVKSIELKDVPDVFRDSIDKAFRSTKWSPAIWFGERTEWRMRLPVVFVLRGYQRGGPLVIEAEAYKRRPIRTEH